MRRYDAAPTCGGVDPTALPTVPTRLKQLTCSAADFEQATLCALARLTPSSVSTAATYVDVTATSAFTSTSPATIALLPNLQTQSVLNRVRPRASGSADITATFHGVQSAVVSFTGDTANPVAVASFTLAAPWSDACGGLCKTTFAAVKDTQATLVATVTLDDGFVFSSLHLLGSESAALEVLDVTRVFSFTTDGIFAIAINAFGGVTLGGNSDSGVTLQAESTCVASGPALQQVVVAYANLEPGAMDVDVGEVYGAPLQQQPAADPVTLLKV